MDLTQEEIKEALRILRKILPTNEEVEWLSKLAEKFKR